MACRCIKLIGARRLEDIRLEDMGLTHIWVLAHFLDDILIEVTRVAQQLAGDVVCVLQAREDGLLITEHAALAELHALLVPVFMDTLDPRVMSLGGALSNMVLEDNNVGVGDVLRGGR